VNGRMDGSVKIVKMSKNVKTKMFKFLSKFYEKKFLEIFKLDHFKRKKCSYKMGRSKVVKWDPGWVGFGWM
jgi:hypothetical protein